MPDFGFDGVSSSLAEFMSSLLTTFFQLFFNTFFCILYVTQAPQTTDSTRAVQGASYNELHTIHACRPPAQQKATCGQRCITAAIASYLIVAFVTGPCDL